MTTNSNEHKIKPASQWVDEGVPLPAGKAGEDYARYTRWVAMIQEDAVACYATTEAIEAVEQKYKELSSYLDALNIDANPEALHLLGEFEAVLKDLSALKMPWS